MMVLKNDPRDANEVEFGLPRWKRLRHTFSRVLMTGPGLQGWINCHGLATARF